MKKQKRLLLLGGIRYLLPVIKAAHELGYYVITADYLPNNVAHKYSDEYVNVSIVDKEAVLKVAKEKQIDGIMSFGVDPGVVAASYVQNQLGLPSFGPFESVEILQNKDKFRAFLRDNGFNVPKAKGFATMEEALSDLSWYEYPVIVKPTDSCGSKGVSRVDNEKELKPALETAFQHSIKGSIIVEEFLEKVGCSSDTDCFSVDGTLKFVNYNSQYFDPKASNPYTPAAYSWPSTFSDEVSEYLTSEIQRLITLLGLKTCVYNVETRTATNGKSYIMELSPRGGGNRLCEMLRYATGVDMITAITQAMVGDEFNKIEQNPLNGHWAEIILHAEKAGIFDRLDITLPAGAELVERDLWVEHGEKVDAFDGANNTIGTLVLRFENQEQMKYALQKESEWIKVVLE